MAKKGAKLVIDNDELTQEFFEDARLIGIVAPLKGYQFCGGLNDTLRVKFKLSNDIGIELKKKGRDYFFARSMPAAIMAPASAASIQWETFTHLPSSRSL